MATAGDLINLALRDAGVIGIGQTPLAEDSNNALTRLNSMLAQFTRKRWLLWHLLDVAKVSTGAVSYTIGTGQDFNTTRPDRLEGGCFARLTTITAPNQPDYPLEVIPSREDYSRIVLKQLSSFPQFVFYDAVYPIGVIYVWPVPTAAQYEIHLAVKDQLVAFANLAATFNMPPEYEEAVRLNLAKRLRLAYQLPNDPDLTGLASAALDTIKNANAQIPTLRMPPGLAGAGRYNIYSDQTY